MSTTVQKSIRVDAPISAVYNQWTQFEEFPQFMGGVQSVVQLGDKRLHWVAEIAGIRREWDAEILQQIPDELVAWAATQGATNAGQVTFHAVGDLATEVSLRLEYEPEGIVEAVGDRLNIIEKQAESDLNKFKEFIEAQGLATGGWRGSVNETSDMGTVGIEAAGETRGDSGKAGVSPKTVAAGIAAAAAVAAAAVAAKRSGGEDGSPDMVDVQPMTSEVTDADVIPVSHIPAEQSESPVVNSPAPSDVDGPESVNLSTESDFTRS